MVDVLMLLVSAAFFGVAIAYARSCERL